MDYLEIEGGHPLKGSIRIHGAKNAALPLMVLTLLTPKTLVLENMPLTSDIVSMSHLLQGLGTQISCHERQWTLCTPSLASQEAPYDIMRKMRASILVLGALLARCGYAKVSLPGGCAIGTRPIDFHLEGLKSLGVQIELDQGYIIARAEGGLRGGHYNFPIPSVTGTANVLFAAVLAQGESCLSNVALEPEITDLITCLRSMGAKIEGQGTSVLHIQGCQTLRGAHHTVLPDRIEIGTYMVAAAMTQGNVLLEGARMDLLTGLELLASKIGFQIVQEDKGVRVSASHAPRAFDLCTAPFPGFPTDLQAQFMAMACIGQGVSQISETIWENRFMHVAELIRMGAHISVNGHTATIYGQDHLCGAPVMATDLRASVALVLAALVAHGTSTVQRIYHLDRGYESLEEQLSLCGANIRRLNTESHTMPTPYLS